MKQKLDLVEGGVLAAAEVRDRRACEAEVGVCVWKLRLL